MSHRDYGIYPMAESSFFEQFSEKNQLETRIKALEKRLAAAHQAINEARPIGEALDGNVVLIGKTLCVSSALSQAIKAFDNCCAGCQEAPDASR